MSLSVFDGDEIASRHWLSTEDIALQTPGLVARSFSGASSIGLFSIRGVAQNDFNDHQEAPVAIYVDQAYQPFTGSATIELFDIERVEVLRGPQGTLFGRNATGGLIDIITRKPTATVEGYAQLSIESFGDRRLEAALSGPLTPELRVRLAVAKDKSDGFFRLGPERSQSTLPTLFGGFPVLADAPQTGSLRNRDQFNARMSVEADPLPGLRIRYAFAYGRVDTVRNGYDTLPAPQGRIDRSTTDFFGTPFDPRRLRESPDLIGYVDKHSHSHTLEADLDLGSWQVNLLGTAGKLDKSYLEDDDGGPFAIGLFGTDQHADHRSVELRASTRGERALWTVGANLLDARGDYFATFQFPAITGATGPGTFDGFGLGYDAEYHLRTRSAAFFAQTELEFAEDWRLIAGLRGTHDDQDFVIAVRCVDDPAALPASPCAAGGVAPGSVAALAAPASLSQSHNLVSGKLQVEYAPAAGRLFWLGYNRGVKGGGFTAPLDGLQTAARLPYGPETLHAFEVGLKLGRPGLNLSVSAFSYIYHDYQGFVIEGPTTIVDNFPARIFGAEAELAAKLPGGVALRGGLAVLDARVRNVEVAPGIRAGQRMTLAPRLSANGTLEKEIRYPGDVSLRFGADGEYVGSMVFNTINSPLVKADSYARLSLRAALAFPVRSARGELSLYVRDVFNARPLTYAFDLSTFFGNVLQVHAPPRTFGASMRFSFGSR